MSALAASLLAQQHDRFLFIGVKPNGLIAWIVIGLIAGWVAGKISRGQGFGCIVNIILGLVGAVVGGWIFSKLGAAWPPRRWGLSSWWPLPACLPAVARIDGESAVCCPVVG